MESKAKAGWSSLGQKTNRCYGWRCVKCKIHFDGREMACIKFEPVRRWQIRRIKDPAPVVKAPCTRADAYLLLIREIQMNSNINRFCPWKKLLPLTNVIRPGVWHCAEPPSA